MCPEKKITIYTKFDLNLSGSFWYFYPLDQRDGLSNTGKTKVGFVGLIIAIHKGQVIRMYVQATFMPLF